MQSDAVKFMRRLHLWENAALACQKKKIYIYSVILCSHCSVNTSWHSYGSVSKHVIIRIVVMPPTIYYNCNNKSLIWSEQ